MRGKPSKQNFPAMDPNLGGIMPPNYADMILNQAVLSDQISLSTEKSNLVSEKQPKRLIKTRFKK